MSDSFEESDEEYSGLLKQAFEVKLCSDFDPNSAPKDGYEFLQHVVYERKKCRQVSVAKNLDSTRFRKNQTNFIAVENPVKSLKINSPSLKWQNSMLEKFTSFRKFVELIEKPEPTKVHVEKASFLTEITVRAPEFSTFFKYTQCAKIKMLEIITEYLYAKDNIEENVGHWIFAILATLEIPLSPTTHFSLRKFARLCLNIRSKLTEDADEDKIKSLNFFICIISMFFKQLDLAQFL